LCYREGWANFLGNGLRCGKVESTKTLAISRTYA
jgi:hypothetical protein